MKDNHEGIAGALAAVVGNDQVSPNQSVKIDSLTPAWLVEPGQAEEVAACLRVCSEFDAAVVPAGAKTWLASGNPLRRADVILSLKQMTRVVEYSPPDLTVTVEAGLSLAALNEHLSQHNLWLPLDPPGDARMTVGAVAACAAFGSLRLGFGTPRDYCIGLRLAHIDGNESKSGGRVVKNVAGYDLNKLYVGSYGTLAVLTEVTFKLRPLPERFVTLLITTKNGSPLIDAARLLNDSASLLPASISLAVRVPGIAAETLLVRFAESDTVVRYQVEEVKRLLSDEFQIAPLNEAEAETIWRQVANLEALTDIAVRLHLPRSALAEGVHRILASAADCLVIADAGTGVVRVAFSADEKQAVTFITTRRREAHSAGGTLFIEHAPAAVRETCNAWEEAGEAATLMRGLKKNFDPQSLLNPGKFIAGI